MDGLTFAALAIATPAAGAYLLAMRFRTASRRAWTIYGALAGVAAVAAVFSWTFYVLLFGSPWQHGVYERNMAAFRNAIYRGEPRTTLERRIPRPDSASAGSYYYISHTSFCIAQFGGYRVRFNKHERVDSWAYVARADGC